MQAQKCMENPVVITQRRLVFRRRNQLEVQAFIYKITSDSMAIIDTTEPLKEHRWEVAKLVIDELTTGTTRKQVVLLVKLIEPPCTERYARWCERSGNHSDFPPTRSLHDRCVFFQYHKQESELIKFKMSTDWHKIARYNSSKYLEMIRNAKNLL